MSIKQDLDNELNKRVSDKQKEIDLVKETYQEDKAIMLKYLKENDITTKLGDIVRWARDKGFTKLFYDSVIYEAYLEDYYQYDYKFYVRERKFIFWDFYHATVKAEVSDDKRIVWTVAVGSGEETGIQSGKTEEEMFEKFKKYFVDLVEGKL